MRFSRLNFVAAALLIAQFALPLAWLGHELIEARADAVAAHDASGKTPDHHDESRCNVCQAVAAVRGHLTTPPAQFAIQILERAHESAAILIVAAREQVRLTTAHPRGPPAAV